MKPSVWRFTAATAAKVQRLGLAAPAAHIPQHPYIAERTKPPLPDLYKHAAQHHDIWLRLGG